MELGDDHEIYAKRSLFWGQAYYYEDAEYDGDDNDDDYGNGNDDDVVYAKGSGQKNKWLF